MKKKQPIKDSDFARKYALNQSIRYLTIRARSVKEIYDYLERKKFVIETINHVLKQLVDLKYLNDEDFAMRWTEQRQNYKGKSKLIIKNELKQKGVNVDTINKVLNDAEDDLESAKIAYRKKARILNGLSKKVFNKKMMGFLARRGFSWETIRKVINEND
jgi:regulatory protein